MAASSRPDLSNTAFTMEALAACGAGPNDEAIQRALIFVSRCQNLEGPDNTTPVRREGQRRRLLLHLHAGPAGQGAADAQRRPAERGQHDLLRPEEHDLCRTDPRRSPREGGYRAGSASSTTSARIPAWAARACITTITPSPRPWTPWESTQIEDAKGVKHDWRRELTEELAAQQQPNGSWVNPDNHWLRATRTW